MGLYKRKDSQHYWMSFKIKKRRIFESTGTSNRRLAEKIYAKRYNEVIEGKWFSEEVKRKTLKDLIERYTAEYLPKKKRPERDKSIFKHLYKFFGEDTLLSEIENTVGLYEQYRVKQKRKPATISKELGLLKRMFNVAIKRWRWTKENPVSFIEMPKVSNERCRYLSTEEYIRLFKVLDTDIAPEWLEPFVKVALNTGLREGNILAMRWSWVSLPNRSITIGGEHMKNNENLGIPLTQEAYDVLRGLSKVRRIDTDLVFHEEGKPIYPVKLQRAFKAVCEAAKIKNFRFHDLRHTFASYLRQRGVDLHTLSKLLSHKDTRMTQRYAHLSVEHLRQAVSVLDSGYVCVTVDKKEGVTHSLTP